MVNSAFTPGIALRSYYTDHAALSLLAGSFEQQVNFAASMGYKSVSIMELWPDKSIELEAVLTMRQILRDHNMTCHEIITGELANQRGLYLGNSSDEVIDGLIATARTLNAQICLGKYLGSCHEVTLLRFIEKCRDKLVRVTIEPIPHTDFFCCRRVVDFIRDNDLANCVGITLDTCHANSYGNIVAEIFSGGEYIKHVHIADSNREFPGSGNINFKIVLEALRMVKYKGPLTLEIYPKPYPDVALVHGAQFMRNYAF